MFLYIIARDTRILKTRISRFAGFISTMRMLLWGRVEKTNKSELQNRLTYRVLIYIFEVGMKTFFLKWEILRSKSQFENFFFEKTAFFWGWKLNFFWAHIIIMQDTCNKFIGSKKIQPPTSKKKAILKIAISTSKFFIWEKSFHANLKNVN